MEPRFLEKDFDNFYPDPRPAFVNFNSSITDEGIFVEDSISSASPNQFDDNLDYHQLEAASLSFEKYIRKDFEKLETSANDHLVNKVTEEKVIISPENFQASFWSEHEDKLLLKAAVQLDYDWKKIAPQFKNKKITATFVKLRYQKLTDSENQLRTKFHPLEDLMLAKYFEKYRFNWTKIAQHFKSRTPLMLKNRYYSFIRKRDLLGFLLQKVKEIEQTGSPLSGIKDANFKAEIAPNDNIPYNQGFQNYNHEDWYGNNLQSSQQKQLDGFPFHQDYKYLEPNDEKDPIQSLWDTEIINNKSFDISRFEESERGESPLSLNNVNEVQDLKKKVQKLKLLLWQTKLELENLKTQLEGHNFAQ